MRAKPSSKREGRRGLLSYRLEAALERHRTRLPAVALALGFVVCGAGSILMGQDNNWDLRNYHYYNPYAFLADRIGYDIAPAQRQSYLNPLLDMPFYFGTRNLDPRLHAFLMGGVHGLSFGLLFAICSVVFRNWSPNVRLGMSALSAALGLYGPIFVGELGASENDTLINLFVLASLLILVRGLATGRSPAARESRMGLVVASAIFGMGTGLKPTIAPFAVGTAVALLAVAGTWRERVQALLIWSASFLVGFLITNGFWMLRLWQHFHNPFFPFYNDIFKSPWANISSYADRAQVPKTVVAALARPFELLYKTDYSVRSYEVRDLRYAALIAVLAAIVVAWACRMILGRKKAPRRWPLQSLSVESRFLLIAFAVSFVVWQSTFAIFRYAATLEALAPLLLVVLICDLSRHFIVRTGLVTLLFVSTAMVMKPMNQARMPFGDSFWEVRVSADAISNPQDAIVLLANPRPWAYLAAWFPPEVRWVGLNNNLTRVPEKSWTQATIRKLIDTHQGDIYLLSRNAPSVWHAYDRRVMAAYGLEVVEDMYWPIESKHSRPGLRLWALRRKAGLEGPVVPPPPADP